MSTAAGNTMESLRRRWRRRVSLGAAFAALAAALPLLALARLVPPGSPAAAGAIVSAVVAALLAYGLAARRWRAGPEEIARHLDRALPEMEDSTDLLLRVPAELGPLQRLQRARVSARLPRGPRGVRLPSRPLVHTARWLALSAALSGATLIALPARGPGAVAGGDGAATGQAAETSIAAATVRVEPPAYTGLPTTETPGFDVTAPAGARLTWRVRIDGEADAAALSFLDDEIALARAEDGAWRADRVADAPQIYVVRVEKDGREILRTPRARIDVVADRPPAIRIESPEPDLVVELDAPGGPVLEVVVEDDYAVGEAVVVATLARGAGEIVEFRSRRIEFDRVSRAAPGRHRLSHAFDLRGLGLEPGAELYYHVEAEDNRRPQPNRGRSPSRRLRVPGGSGLRVSLEASLPILRAPEFFRSQRQIIIDTERLLEDEDRISRDEFAHRSELLGFDQGALRMRYGALLGEEFVSGRAAGDDGDEHGDGGLVDPTARQAPMRPAELAEMLSGGEFHEHDAAEINTYFDSEVKETLKAALAEMWNAEGQLRTHAPGEALPFEYRALKFLKEVQEAQRIYVQKVGFQPPPLAPDEKRLTGELDDVQDLRDTGRSEPPDQEPEARRALDAVAALRRDPAGRPADLPAILDALAAALARRALEDPSTDLTILDELDALRRPEAPLDGGGLEAMERAAWSLLPQPSPQPPDPRPAGGSLFDAYLRALRAEAP